MPCSFDPHKAIREAIRGAEAISVYQILVGGVVTVIGYALGRPKSLTEHLGAISALTFLITPGVMQQLIASMLSRRQRQCVLWSTRMMLAESVLAVTTPFIYHFSPILPLSAFLMMNMVNIVVVPAMLAQVWSMRKAMRAIEMLPSKLHGFEITPAEEMQSTKERVVAVSELTAAEISQ